MQTDDPVEPVAGDVVPNVSEVTSAVLAAVLGLDADAVRTVTTRVKPRSRLTESGRHGPASDWGDGTV